MSATTILFKLKSMAILLAGIFLLVACDKIDEPFTKKAASGGNDTTGGVTKRVLLEDYTGHTCVNCPKAAKIAQGLKTTYGDRLVVLAIHAGGFANPTSGGDFTYDFRTDAGTAWDSFFGISNVGNPNGLVNRKGYPGNHILSPSAWGGAISTALAGEPELDLAISNQYNASTRQLSIEITTTFLSPLDISLHLVVVLTESGIVKPQRNNDATIGIVPVIPDYVHNHVLRAAITSTWGTQVTYAGSTYPAPVIKSFTYALNSGFVPENCEVVAFVYNSDTKEVLQAAEADLVQ